jgi:hypothetical protein
MNWDWEKLKQQQQQQSGSGTPPQMDDIVEKFKSMKLPGGDVRWCYYYHRHTRYLFWKLDDIYGQTI